MKPDADGWLRCSCCGLPIARLDKGNIVIQGRHYGKEKHENRIRLEDLLAVAGVETKSS